MTEWGLLREEVGFVLDRVSTGWDELDLMEQAWMERCPPVPSEYSWDTVRIPAEHRRRLYEAVSILDDRGVVDRQTRTWFDGTGFRRRTRVVKGGRYEDERPLLE
jgi:hypothetical protein